MALPPGTRVGPYTILNTLGAGGMGEVYRAEDSRLQRTVAIKVLPRHLATPDRIERFEREARAASSLNHPNILTIHDVGRDGDMAWFASELVDGESLREMLRNGPLPTKRAIEIARQVAEGLARAHAAGIVHRDLKPENVMVTREGLTKIVDFGIARSAASAATGSEATATAIGGTEPGLVIGTLGYLSPEQASGRPVDYRADQFALGLLIYELVTRTRPFERPTTAQSLAATIEADAPALETLNPDVPPHLAAIVERLLAKNPADRYESTRDLARELATALDGLSRRTGRENTTGSTVVEPGRRFGRSTRSLAAAAGIILIAAAAIAAWLWRDRPATPEPQQSQEQERPLVAVRAFRSLSPDVQQAYFAAGMTEEIRGRLSQVAALRVLSRTALDSYREDDARAVRELGVRNFVDGSVRVEGGRVRVSAELVDASTRETRWSQQYDRQLADVLAVQSEIAQQITRALDTNLSPAEQARLGKRPTENLDAYSLYLKSSQESSFDPARNLVAIDLLRKALALDPQFAAAQARIAYRLIFSGYYSDPSNIDKGIAEAEAALRIESSMPYAYFALGTAYAMKGRGAESRQAFLRALELDPNNTSAMNNLSIAELQYGRLDESAYWGRRSFLRSGRRGNEFYHLIIPVLNLRADVESRVLLEEAERRSAGYHRVQMMLALLELFEGRPEAAVARAQALAEREPTNEEVRFHRADVAFLVDAPDLEERLAPLMERSASNRLWVAESVRVRYAYALRRRDETGRSAALIGEAERVSRETMDAGNDTPALGVELAAIAALRGDTTAAIEWLERAFEAGYRDEMFLERSPIFRAGLGSDGRFKSLLEQIRRDVAAQRERARARGLLELQSLLPVNGGS